MTVLSTYALQRAIELHSTRAEPTTDRPGHATLWLEGLNYAQTFVIDLDVLRHFGEQLARTGLEIIEKFPDDE